MREVVWAVVTTVLGVSFFWAFGDDFTRPQMFTIGLWSGIIGAAYSRGL